MQEREKEVGNHDSRWGMMVQQVLGGWKTLGDASKYPALPGYSAVQNSSCQSQAAFL